MLTSLTVRLVLIIAIVANNLRAITKSCLRDGLFKCNALTFSNNLIHLANERKDTLRFLDFVDKDRSIEAEIT